MSRDNTAFLSPTRRNNSSAAFQSPSTKDAARTMLALSQLQPRLAEPAVDTDNSNKSAATTSKGSSRGAAALSLKRSATAPPKSAKARSEKADKPSEANDPSYNRKEKSLGLLCEKWVILLKIVTIPLTPCSFVARFGSGKDVQVSLDDAARELGVERRRIYDIVNILESLQMVSRLKKNKYRWHGTRDMETVLQVLGETAKDDQGIDFDAAKRLAMQCPTMDEPLQATAEGDRDTPSQGRRSRRASEVADTNNDDAPGPKGLVSSRRSQPPLLVPKAQSLTATVLGTGRRRTRTRSVSRKAESSDSDTAPGKKTPRPGSATPPAASPLDILSAVGSQLARGIDPLSGAAQDGGTDTQGSGVGGNRKEGDMTVLQELCTGTQRIPREQCPPTATPSRDQQENMAPTANQAVKTDQAAPHALGMHRSSTMPSTLGAAGQHVLRVDVTHAHGADASSNAVEGHATVTPHSEVSCTPRSEVSPRCASAAGPDQSQDSKAKAEAVLLGVTRAVRRAAEVPRREKSLGVLSQRFIQLFLIADALGRRMVLPLEEAARLLRGMDQATGKPLEDDSNDGSAKRLKTKVRRLYDIANVLSSLKLIDKVQSSTSRKPAFRWLGMDFVPTLPGCPRDTPDQSGRASAPPSSRAPNTFPANDHRLLSKAHYTSAGASSIAVSSMVPGLQRSVSASTSGSPSGSGSAASASHSPAASKDATPSVNLPHRSSTLPVTAAATRPSTQVTVAALTRTNSLSPSSAHLGPKMPISRAPDGRMMVSAGGNTHIGSSQPMPGTHGLTGWMQTQSNSPLANTAAAVPCMLNAGGVAHNNNNSNKGNQAVARAAMAVYDPLARQAGVGGAVVQRSITLPTRGQGLGMSSGVPLASGMRPQQQQQLAPAGPGMWSQGQQTATLQQMQLQMMRQQHHQQQQQQQQHQQQQQQRAVAMYRSQSMSGSTSGGPTASINYSMSYARHQAASATAAAMGTVAAATASRLPPSYSMAPHQAEVGGTTYTVTGTTPSFGVEAQLHHQANRQQSLAVTTAAGAAYTDMGIAMTPPTMPAGRMQPASVPTHLRAPISLSATAAMDRVGTSLSLAGQHPALGLGTTAGRTGATIGASVSAPTTTLSAVVSSVGRDLHAGIRFMQSPLTTAAPAVVSQASAVSGDRSVSGSTLTRPTTSSGLRFDQTPEQRHLGTPMASPPAMSGAPPSWASHPDANQVHTTEALRKRKRVSSVASPGTSQLASNFATRQEFAGPSTSTGEGVDMTQPAKRQAAAGSASAMPSTTAAATLQQQPYSRSIVSPAGAPMGGLGGSVSAQDAARMMMSPPRTNVKTSQATDSAASHAPMHALAGVVSPTTTAALGLAALRQRPPHHA